MDLATAVRRGLTLTWAAACCAAEPALDGLLVFDLPAPELFALAGVLAEALAAVSPTRPPRLVRLGSNETEDDLWFSLRPLRAEGVTTLVPAPGVLVPRANESALVVVVTDLARLSLAASRAAATSLGSGSAELQRHGRSQRWKTSAYWVAGCPAASAGQVSQHLLDRFAVRLTAPRRADAADRTGTIMRALESAAQMPQATVPALPRQWRAALARSGPVLGVDDLAIERAIALHHTRHGMRRPLALLRLARGTARLAGDQVVTASHVQDVAVVTGIASPASARRSSPAPAEREKPRPRRHRDRQARAPANGTFQAEPAPAVSSTAEPVLLGAPAEPLAAITVTASSPVPYPEDTADPDREAEPLRLPAQRAAGHPADRGPVVGTSPARTLADLAWFDTVRHAALYQHFRGPAASPGRLQVTPADLRSYQRAARPERMLVLLLDHTCRYGWNWLPTLAPYLHRAYAGRAAICLVEVGGHDAASPLRAERSMLRSLLDPRAAAALSREPGIATPLAHGLELASQALRHALQHGAATFTEAEVVIVTDGLGNVPLDVSTSDRLTGPVSGEGVADAIDAARTLKDIDNARIVVIQPPRVPHPDILLALVDAVSSERALVTSNGT